MADIVSSMAAWVAGYHKRTEQINTITLYEGTEEGDENNPPKVRVNADFQVKKSLRPTLPVFFGWVG